VQYQAQWAGRIFSLCVDEASRERFYLVEEPAHASGALPDLPGLTACDGGREGTRTWSAPVVRGQTLAAMREAGGLSADELRGALLAVVDALQCLAGLYPPVVPACIDPACVVRGERGWVLDFVRLALVAEARRPGGYPPGVQAVGGLLRWLGSGRRVASLADLRSELEQQGAAAELGALLRPAEGAPEAVAAAAAGGGAPARAGRLGRVAAWGAVLVGVMLVGMLAGGAIRAAVQASPIRGPGPGGPAAGPGTALGGGRSGDVVDRPDALKVQRARPSVAAEAEEGSAGGPGTEPVWANLPAPPPVPATLPGALESQDAAAGGVATAVSLDGRWMGYAWVYQARSGVYISLDAFNQMFHHFYRWHDNGDGTFTIWDGTSQFKTANGGVFDGRLWLDLDSSLRSELGVSLVDWSERQLHFVSER
jgi:hypothetical protein